MDELWMMLTGGYTKWQLLGYFIFFLIGMFLFSYLEVENRNVKSTETPKKFSWKFFYKDNIKRYIGSIVLIYVLFRFYPELTGQDLNEFSAIMLGFMGDGIVGMKKSSSKLLRANRNKILSEDVYE